MGARRSGGGGTAVHGGGAWLGMPCESCALALGGGWWRTRESSRKDTSELHVVVVTSSSNSLQSGICTSFFKKRTLRGGKTGSIGSTVHGPAHSPCVPFELALFWTVL